jgi:hypothetical protein
MDPDALPHEASNDSFDMSEIDSDKENINVSNAGNDGSHRKIVQKFADEKAKKLDHGIITNEIESMKATNCCACKCTKEPWFTEVTVFSCRQKYLSNQTRAERREWLSARLSEMACPKSSLALASYSYQVEVPDGGKAKCCSAVWSFAYGVSPITRKRASSIVRNGPAPEERIQRRKTTSKAEKEMFMISWLEQYASTYGDVMPFGNNPDKTEIRLPLGTKSLVYEAYLEACANDPTYFMDALQYNRFVATWKKTKNLEYIKCSKFKPGFAKCDKCWELADVLKKKLDPVVREQTRHELNTHIQEERLERQQYYRARAKAVDRQDKYLSIIMDAMDQSKTRLPYFVNPPKCVGSDSNMKAKLTAAVIHGHGLYIYWCTPRAWAVYSKCFGQLTFRILQLKSFHGLATTTNLGSQGSQEEA